MRYGYRSTVTANKFYTTEDCINYLKELGMGEQEVNRLREIALLAEKDFVTEMNMYESLDDGGMANLALAQRYLPLLS